MILGIVSSQMISGIDPDIGKVWTLRSTPADRTWKSIAWSPQLGLYVSVASHTSTPQKTELTGNLEMHQVDLGEMSHGRLNSCSSVLLGLL